MNEQPDGDRTDRDRLADDRRRSDRSEIDRPEGDSAGVGTTPTGASSQGPPIGRTPEEQGFVSDPAASRSESALSSIVGKVKNLLGALSKSDESR